MGFFGGESASVLNLSCSLCLFVSSRCNCSYHPLTESLFLISSQRLQHFIGRRSDVLAMSADGPLNAFVNPHGFVHETLTLKVARGLHLVGRAETENSWFPG